MTLLKFMRFDQRKATQAAAYLLRLRGGRMSYMKLIKLLYLADRAALIRWGRPITTDRHFSMPKGPVVSIILEMAAEEPVPGQTDFWHQHISAQKNFEVTFEKDPGRDEISDAEIAILDEVFREHGKKSRWELVDYTHKLPEWVDPDGGSIPITVKDILRVAGKTEIEARAVENELAELSFADFLFRK